MKPAPEQPKPGEYDLKPPSQPEGMVLSPPDREGVARTPVFYVPACGVLADLFWWARGCRSGADR